MSKVSVLILLVFASITASAQVSLDSMKRSIKKVNVQKSIVEDHARLIAEYNSLTAQYKDLQRNLNNITDQDMVHQHELNLYRVLEYIELKEFYKISNSSFKPSTSIELDTAADGTLRNLTIFFEAINEYGDTGELKLGLPLEISIAKNDAWLRRFYPYTSSLIAGGTIVVKIIPVVPVAMSNVPRLNFPPLIVQGNAINKAKYAGDFLTCIRTICDKFPMDEYKFAKYQQFEKSEVPDKNLDKLLGIRVAFIKVLKDAYDKKYPQ